eukprot:7701612-Prorocentrum_lima.AAC.1
MWGTLQGLLREGGEPEAAINKELPISSVAEATSPMLEEGYLETGGGEPRVGVHGERGGGAAPEGEPSEK